MAESIWSTEDLDRVVAGIRETTAKTFREEGKCPMHAMVFASKGPNGEAQESIAYVMPDPDKDLFASAVRGAVRALGGRCVVLACEAWTLRSAKGGAAGDAELAREADKYPSLEQHPNRQESLICMVERVDRAPEQWWAPITRDVGGKPTLGDWERMPTGDMRGRFVDFVRAGS